MCFKKKRRIGEIYTQDRKCILLCAQEMDVLIALDRNGIYGDKFLELKDELLFLSPRENIEVYEIDKKIRNKIDDLKLILNKPEEIEKDAIENKINNVFVMIKERDAKELK